MQSNPVLSPERSAEGPQDVYTPSYCEENVYFLCRRLLFRSVESPRFASRIYAVFVSNAERKVPFWRQRSAANSEAAVVWDYHVFALEVSAAGVWIWDLDSTLEVPCQASTYVSEALRPDLILPEAFQRYYRLAEAQGFLEHFASDRSHMIGADGKWMANPPPYPCIISSGGERMSLPQYVDMQQPLMASADGNEGTLPAEDSKHGFVLAESQFFHQVLS